MTRLRLETTPPPDDARRSTCRLCPTARERAALEATLRAYAEACAHAYEAGRAAGTTGNARIHARCYHDLRRRYELSANLAVRAVARAAEALKRSAAAPGNASGDGQPVAVEVFYGAVDYDARILSVDAEARTVSLSTVRGRLRALALEECLGVPLGEGRRLLRGRLRRTPDAAFVLAIEWHA